jgi:hypothetical protein
MNTIDNMQDVLDSRDIFERIEELEQVRDDFYAENEITPNEIGNMENLKYKEWEESDDAKELNDLSSFMDDFKGYGGDEQWRGDWYPVTIIRDSYFEDYTEELIKDCGYIDKDFPSWIAIDWGKTAEAVQEDYTSAEFDGITYWAR